MQSLRWILRCSALIPLVMLLLATAGFAQVPTRPYAPVQDGPVFTAEARPVYVPGRLVVQFDANVAPTVENHQTAPGKTAVTVRTGVPSVDRLVASLGLREVVRSLSDPQDVALAARLGLDRWYRLEFAADTDLDALASALRADPNVEAATPDYYAFTQAVPDDALYSDQWGHDNTAQMLDYCWGCGGHPAGSPVGTVGFDANAQLAWDQPQGYGDPGIVIAIIDSGTDVDHPDLVANLVAGWDFGDGDSNPDDDSAEAGHGTSTAGVAAAVANNTLGVAGIAGGCSIMPLKVSDSGGSITFSSIRNALVYAADNGARVASLSLGAAIANDPATDATIEYAAAAGVVILAASGNANSSSIEYPANHAEVIAVGAASPCGDRKRSSSSPAEVNPGVNTDPNGYTCDGERWWGSSYGLNVQDAAGAVDVIAPTIQPTTDIAGAGGYEPGDYGLWFNGTSCATPYAAGVCGLILSNDPALTRAQVRAQLTTTAIDIVNVESGVGWDRYSGYGMVDAAAALGPAVNPPEMTVAPAALAFTVPVDGSDSAPLTISNIAASPANDLVWTLVGQEVAAASPPADSAARRVDLASSQTIELPLPGNWRFEPRQHEIDPRDPALQRLCSDCRTAHKASQPGGEIEFAASAVNDGSFEAGSGSGNWSESSTNFGTPLCTTAVCGTGGGTGPRTGAWWCWFGGIAGVTEDGAVSQVVNIPAATSVTLDFHLELPSCDSGADFMEVTIDGNQEFLITGNDGYCGVTGYRAYQVDISAYADGGNHTLRFHSTTFSNLAGVTNFFLDDISINVAATPCSWLSATPDGGTTSAGDSDVVTVVADATGLAPGVYDCTLEISSNDPVTPMATVPVQLTVIDVVDVFVSTAATDPVTVLVSPDGGGNALSAAQDWDGVVGSTPGLVDATVSVTLTRGGVPVVGHPADQIQLMASAGGWSLCAGTNAADGPTDGAGTATFSGPLFGGGASNAGELLQVVVSGVSLGTVTYAGGGTGLDIRINSPDINDDKVVNLTDLGHFSADFLAYAFRSDYQWNGVHNLVDVSRIASAFGSSCPAPKRAGFVAAGRTASPPVADATLGLYFDRQGHSRVTSLEPGREATVHLLLKGPAARRGILAWEAGLGHSDNVVVENVALAEGSLNLATDLDFVVGLGDLRKSSANEPLELATLRLSVTDTAPAYLTLSSSALCSTTRPCVSTTTEVLAVEVAAGAPGDPVAFLNDDSLTAGINVPAKGLDLRNQPNPFNPSTQILFNLPHPGRVDLRIYDVSGRLVTELGQKVLAAGANELHWNGTDRNGAAVVSGLYFYRLFLDGQSLGSPQKMSLLK